jgi:hypothetical protein
MIETEISTTLATCRTLENDRSIALKSTKSVRGFQRNRLARCRSFIIALAAIIVSLLYGEAVR